MGLRNSCEHELRWAIGRLQETLSEVDQLPSTSKRIAEVMSSLRLTIGYLHPEAESKIESQNHEIGRQLELIRFVADSLDSCRDSVLRYIHPSSPFTSLQELFNHYERAAKHRKSWLNHAKSWVVSRLRKALASR